MVSQWVLILQPTPLLSISTSSPISPSSSLFTFSVTLYKHKIQPISTYLSFSLYVYTLREREEEIMDTHASSFSNLPSYLRALSHTPSRFARRAASVSTSYEEMSRVRARSGSDMQRTLRWFDLVGLGIGGMVGAGVFVTTGQAARLYAGPSVVVSYAIAGLCALLSAFCYTEFAVHMPVAGGAFSYLRVTFGSSHPRNFIVSSDLFFCADFLGLSF